MSSSVSPVPGCRVCVFGKISRATFPSFWILVGELVSYSLYSYWKVKARELTRILLDREARGAEMC